MTAEQVDARPVLASALVTAVDHVGIAVPDLDAAIAWFDSHGVSYVKRPEQGKMRDVAFIKDPDGYWIEILPEKR